MLEDLIEESDEVPQVTKQVFIIRGVAITSVLKEDPPLPGVGGVNLVTILLTR